MIDTTYKIVQFPKLGKYVGIAHNYGHALLLSTPAMCNYSEAKGALELLASHRNAHLRWYDGEYRYNDNTGELDVIHYPLPQS